MAANYAGFYVYDQDADGLITNAGSGVSVAIYNITQAATPAESPLSTDAVGFIAAGSLTAGVAGDRVAFRVDNRGGLSASIVQILT